MTSFEPQVGDIVDIRGTVVFMYEDGSFDTEWNRVAAAQHVTLVERPEPKITVELTELQAANLASLAEWHGVARTTLEAAAIIREALNERP